MVKHFDNLIEFSIIFKKQQKTILNIKLLYPCELFTVKLSSNIDISEIVMTNEQLSFAKCSRMYHEIYLRENKREKKI